MRVFRFSHKRWKQTQKCLLIVYLTTAGMYSYSAHASSHLPLGRISSAQGNAGETVRVTLSLDRGVKDSTDLNLTNLAGFSFRLHVTPNDVRLPPLTPIFQPGAGIQGWNTVTSETHPWRYAAITYPGISGPAELWALDLKISPCAFKGGVYTLEIESAQLADDSGAPPLEAASLFESGQILVNEGVATMPGDVNIDGSLNVSDAVLILRYIVGLEVVCELQKSLADFNADQLVNVSDAVAILRRIVGLP